MTSPPLSIVIASYRSEQTISDCLASLGTQCRAVGAEIIVVDSGDDSTAALVSERFPDVTLVREAARQYPGAARNIGVARSSGVVVGFVDADCTVAGDWVARVIDAHGDGVAGVGGAIAPDSPRSALEWAAYFCSFSHWMPGTPAGAMADIPTCCLSLKRWAFDRYGPFRAQGYSSDTELNWKISGAGHRIEFDPRIRVTHAARPTFRAFARRLFERGRAFARMRTSTKSLSQPVRLLFALLSPLLPFVLFARLLRRVVRDRSPYRGALLRAAPVVFVGYCFWSVGELCGYLRS